MAKSRSPEYPAIGLREAIERARQVYESGVYQSPISKEVFAQRMGFKSLSGSSLPVLSALSKYGLIEGRGDATRVSQLAVGIIAHEPGNKERVDAIRAAAGLPDLFSELDRRDPSGKSTDAAIRSHLLTRGFIPPAADAAIRSYRETKALVESESVGHNLDTLDREKPAKNEPLVEVGDLIQIEIGGALQLPKPARVRATQEHEGRCWVFIEGSEAGVPMEQVVVEQKVPATATSLTPPRLPEDKASIQPPGMRREVFTLDEGDVTLIYPNDMSAASCDELGSFLELFMRKTKRRASVAYDLVISMGAGRNIRAFATSKADAIARGVEAIESGHQVLSVEASDPRAPEVTIEMIREKYEEL